MIKKLSNHAIIVTEGGDQFIAMGKGIGLQTKIGEAPDQNLIERLFRESDEALSDTQSC